MEDAAINPFAPPLHQRISSGMETQDDEAIARAMAAADGLLPGNADVSDVGDSLDFATIDEWKVQTGKKQRRAKAGEDGGPVDGHISAVGLGNRYGENNCYLNVVLQSLYRLQPFKRRFMSDYDSKYSKVVKATTPKHPRQLAAATKLLFTLHDMFRSMDATSRAVESFATNAGRKTGVDGVDAALTLTSLRAALHAALVEKESALDAARHSTRRKGTPTSIGTSSTTASAALASAIASRAMADASEAMEEIITLVHESEAVLTSIGRLHDFSTASVISTLDKLQQSTDAVGDGMMSKMLELPQLPAQATSSALGAFGQLIAKLSVCAKSDCGTQTDAVIYTGLAQHVNTLSLLKFRARQLNAKMPTSFAKLVQEVLADDEARPCPTCSAGPMRSESAVVRPPAVFTISLGWLSSREDPESVSAVLDSIDGYIDLFELFHQRGPAGDVVTGMTGVPCPAAPLPARLRAIICYVDNHWVAFFDDSRDPKVPSWICCNDENVFRTEYPIAQAATHRLQPSLLFYETGMVGDAIPTDRGRGALHGDGRPVARIPLSVALAAGATKLVLDSAEFFPTLPSSSMPKAKRAEGDAVATTAEAAVEGETVHPPAAPLAKPKWSALAATAPRPITKPTPIEAAGATHAESAPQTTSGTAPPHLPATTASTKAAPATKPASTPAAAATTGTKRTDGGRAGGRRGSRDGSKHSNAKVASEPVFDEDGFQLVGKPKAEDAGGRGKQDGSHHHRGGPGDRGRGRGGSGGGDRGGGERRGGPRGGAARS